MKKLKIDMHTSIGNKLLELCATAQSTIFLAAPFIKLSTIKRVVQSIPDDVQLTIVGRFAIEDLLSKVTDLSVADYIWDRPKSELLIHPSLHAKLYRIDTSAMIGSANLTFKGLGWCLAPNIELMVNVSAKEPDVIAIEQFLRTHSIAFSHEIYEKLKDSCTSINTSSTAEDVAEIPQTWVPSCRRPELLWHIYQGNILSKCSLDVMESGKKDLIALEIPSWLPKKEFKYWVRAVFKSTPLYHALMYYWHDNVELDDKSAVEWLEKSILCDSKELLAQDAWANIKAWVKEFSDDMKVVPRDEAIIPKNRPTK